MQLVDGALTIAGCCWVCRIVQDGHVEIGALGLATRWSRGLLRGNAPPHRSLFKGRSPAQTVQEASVGEEERCTQSRSEALKILVRGRLEETAYPFPPIGQKWIRHDVLLVFLFGTELHYDDLCVQ